MGRSSEQSRASTVRALLANPRLLSEPHHRPVLRPHPHPLAGSVRVLLGTEADPALGRRDASRLLGRASLLVQQVVGIVTEPVLIPAGTQGVVEAAADARLLVLGLSDRWRSEGLGSARLAVAAGAGVAIVFVRG